MPSSRGEIGVRVARFVRTLGSLWARAGVIGAMSAALAGALASGCYHPREVPCAFSCVSPGARCPTDFTCGTDGVCHRVGADDACTFPEAGAGGTSGTSPDAGAVSDAAPDDGAPDGAPDIVPP